MYDNPMAYGFFETKRLLCEDIDGYNWILKNELVYVSKAGKRYVVPVDTITDFASVPRILWNIYPKTGPWNRSAALHDDLYTRQPGETTKEEADAIFKESMEAIQFEIYLWNKDRPKDAWRRDLPSRTIWTFYMGVRLGGRGIWKRHTAELLTKLISAASSV